MSNPKEQVSPLISQQVANLRGGPSECFLTATQVRARYGNCSDMWLWRRLRDGSGFPPPVLIAARRFWRLTSLIEWERERAVPVPQGPQPSTAYPSLTFRPLVAAVPQPTIHQGPKALACPFRRGYSLHRDGG